MEILVLLVKTRKLSVLMQNAARPGSHGSEVAAGQARAWGSGVPDERAAVATQPCQPVAWPGSQPPGLVLNESFDVVLILKCLD